MSLLVCVLVLFRLVTAAQDAEIDTTGPTSSRLLQLEESEESDFVSTSNVSEVKDGMLVFIINVDFRYSKLGHSPGHCNFEDGDLSKGQIWKLVEDQTRKGLFFLVNFGASSSTTTYRYAFNPDAGGSFCYTGGKHDDQLWKFKKTSDGYWMIYNNAHSDCRIGMWGAEAGGGYCGDAHGPREWFRLVLAFDSSALWQNVDDWDNMTDQTVEHTFKYTEGLSNTIKKTIAEEHGTETSLSIGIEGAVEGLGLSASDTTTVSQSFTETYERSTDHTSSIESTQQYPVPPHTRICIKQLKVNTIDVLNAVGFVFSSALHRVQQGDACD